MILDTETRTHLERCRTNLPASAGDGNVAFGFDGVVDRVRTVVSERAGPDDFERMGSLRQFGERITDSADLDSSCSIEWLSEDTRPGGHVSHLGRTFDRLGYEPTLLGTFGDPLEPIFEEEFERATLVSLGRTSTTDAIEFDDGKVMLSDTGQLATIDWAALLDTVGIETLARHLDGTDALGIGYWATIPNMPSIWRGLAEDLWPTLEDPPTQVLVDPADLRRLDAESLAGGPDALATLDETVPVTVSANATECVELAQLCGVDGKGDSLTPVAENLLAQLGVTRFVAHSVSSAVAAREDNTVAVSIPRCDDPVLTTSAGDHFNAGLLLASLFGMDDGPALIVANSLAGWFVRHGRPPAYDELRRFVEEYDDYFSAE